MHIKICGLTRPEYVEAAASAGASFIGFMFAERSRRHITVEETKRLIAVLPPRDEPTVESLQLGHPGLWFQRCADALDALIARRRPLTVGIFANQPVALVNAVAEAADLDIIQLSGDERWETCLQLRRPTIKALRSGSDCSCEQDLLRKAEAGTASLCLLDAEVPGEYGGTGQLADWETAARVAASIPLMLAGGLTPANVGTAIAAVRPWAVDVSSGVERDGVKDVDLIQDFVHAARSAAVEMGHA
ncbi:MAG: phosphoribosylanthranilate isomerase [Dehalococcoidia bacterium]